MCFNPEGKKRKIKTLQIANSATLSWTFQLALLQVLSLKFWFKAKKQRHTVGSYLCRSQVPFLVGWDLCKSPSYSSGSDGPPCCGGSRRTPRHAVAPLRATALDWSDSSWRGCYTCTLCSDEHGKKKRNIQVSRFNQLNFEPQWHSLSSASASKRCACDLWR